MRIEVRPTDTPMAAAIETSAVAMTELLIGLSAEPMNSGVTNRGPNARPPSGRPSDWPAGAEVPVVVSSATSMVSP